MRETVTIDLGNPVDLLRVLRMKGQTLLQPAASGNGEPAPDPQREMQEAVALLMHAVAMLLQAQVARAQAAAQARVIVPGMQFKGRG